MTRRSRGPLDSWTPSASTGVTIHGQGWTECVVCHKAFPTEYRRMEPDGDDYNDQPRCPECRSLRPRCKRTRDMFGGDE